MRFDESDVRLSGRGLDDDRKKFRLGLGGVELLLEVGGLDAQSVFSLRKYFFERLGIVAHEKNAERRIAVHQDAALAVEHGTARRDNRDGANLITLGEVDKMSGLNDLKLPEADHQENNDNYEDVGHQRQTTLGDFLIITTPRRQ